MDHVGLADNNTQSIPTFPTKRTSPRIFYQSHAAITRAYFSLLYRGEVAPDDDMRRCYNNVSYAFRTLRQSATPYKFPVTFQDLWPYIGIPKEAVARHLRVTVELLDQRLADGGSLFWPSHSNLDNVLLAVQSVNVVDDVNNVYDEVRARHVTVPRQMTFDRVRRRLSQVFGYNENDFDIYTEVDEVRYGPIMTQDGWEEVLAQEEFINYKVHLLMVHYP